MRSAQLTTGIVPPVEPEDEAETTLRPPSPPRTVSVQCQTRITARNDDWIIVIPYGGGRVNLQEEAEEPVFEEPRDSRENK